MRVNEKKHGFSESMPMRTDKSKRVPFFNLGPKNDWKKILDVSYIEKIENIFEKSLKDLNYK